MRTSVGIGPFRFYSEGRRTPASPNAVIAGLMLFLAFLLWCVLVANGVSLYAGLAISLAAAAAPFVIAIAVLRR